MTKEELKKLTAKPLVATGTVTLAAAAADGEGKEPANGNKAMRINAYNGGLINVGWGLPVGVELSGLTWRDDSAIPVLCLHDQHSIDAICGQTKKITADGKSLTVEADFMPVTEEAKKIHELAKAGYRFQASVGVTPDDVLYVEDGVKAVLNGAEVEGECYIVRAGVLNEVSIVPLGADGSTATAIAAASQTGKEGNMPEIKKEVEAGKPAETVTVEAALKAERDRVSSISKVCEGHADIMAQAVSEGWTAEKAELACLKAEKLAAEQEKIGAGRPAAPSIIDLKSAAPKDAKTITAAACMGAAMSEKNLAKQFKDVDLDAAHDLGITRLSDIFAAHGITYRPGVDADMTKALKAAFSTTDIPAILSNVAWKFALAGFGSAGEEWKTIARAVAVKDFKAVKGTRLVMGGLLKPLAKGGELEHVTLGDESRDLAAKTKGSIVGITREDLINDDLGVLATIPERFGMMAGRTINADVFGKLSTTGSDYGANTSGALTLANLETAFALAMGIKDSEGDPIGPMPNTILVSPSNYIAALSIYQSEKVTGGSTRGAEQNVLRGVLKPVSSPYLSGSAYWLFNDMFPLVDVAFLNGRQTPVIETAEADFAQLGIQMRCYFDFGVGAGEYKAALYSTGA